MPLGTEPYQLFFICLFGFGFLCFLLLSGVISVDICWTFLKLCVIKPHTAGTLISWSSHMPVSCLGAASLKASNCTFYWSSYVTVDWSKAFFFSSNLMGCCHSNTSIFHVRKKALYTQHKEETRLSHNHAQHHCQAILVEKTKKTLAYQPPLTVLCISSAKLLRVCSVPSSRSLTKMLNSSSYKKELVERCNSENTCHFSNCDLIFMVYWWVLSKCTGFKIVPS